MGAKPKSRPVEIHLVRDGAATVTTELTDGPSVWRARFRNTLAPHSLERVQRLVEIAEQLAQTCSTAEMLRKAGAAQDPKGGLGALRMLDVEGVLHASAGGRKQLLWNPGRRPRREPVPRAAWLQPTLILREMLSFASEAWLSTDFIVRQAGFDPDLPPDALDDDDRLRGAFRGLPVNFFTDVSKHGRRYALGSLKVLYWRGDVAWRQHSAQSIEWKWIGTGGRRRAVADWPGRPIPRRRFPDAYSDPERYERSQRREQTALARSDVFLEQRQAWIDVHFPKAAQKHKDRQEDLRRAAAARASRGPCEDR